MLIDRSHAMRHRQGGAVMIMFGLLLVVLFGFMALAIDLGRTYVVRTELQNAADAAALAGAKDLNQKATGVSAAINTAITMASQNNFNFATPVSITAANISVGSCPDDGSCTMASASSVTTDAQAAGKTFLKVDIPAVTLNAFFAQVMGITSTSAFGTAVAGYFVVDVSPVGVCAIDSSTPGGRRVVPGLADELTEYGFRRGVSYNLMNLGDVAGVSTPYLINPVDVYPGPCNNNNSSANVVAPYICTGSASVIVNVPGYVYGSTGVSAGPVEKALNSRFDVYTGNTCDPVSAPPDINISEYTVPSGAGAGPAGNPRDWMQPGANTLPSQQSISIDPATHKPQTTLATADYGALWSYSRAVKASGSAPNATADDTANANFGLTDWSNLYAGNTADTTATGYPSAPSTSPYNTTTGSKYFTAPSHTGKINRRVLQIAIVDCANSTGNNCAAKIKIVGVGRFFMTTKANLPSVIYGEFDGLLDPVPPSDIRLYK